MTANITALSPAPSANCLLRSSTNMADRTLTLTGTGFPFPRYSENLQFRREDTGVESIHFGMQVAWTSASQISVDISSISHLLWLDAPKVALQVRITTYDPAWPQGQRPISHWSDAQVVLAANAAACQCTNDTGVRPTLSYYPLREPTQGVLPTSMELFQFAMYNLSDYGSTSGRHPGTDFLEMTGVNQFRSGLQVAAAGDGTILGYYDPDASPTGLTDQPSWVPNVSPTDTAQGRAYVVIAHGKVIAVYAHMAPGLRVRRAYGARIHGGEVLGVVGTHERGDHLHLETRTYGQWSYDLAENPLVFVNAWDFFNPTVQGWINTNINNRATIDGKAALGWNGAYSGGTQRTQCFTGALSVYGYNTSGQHARWEESNSLPTGPTVTIEPTLLSPSTWHTFCVP